MRRIQNKNVAPDLSFPEIKGTVLKRLHLLHKGSRCLPRLEPHKHSHVRLRSVWVFEKRNSFVSFGDVRKLLEPGPRWDVAKGGFAALQSKIGPGYRVDGTSQVLGVTEHPVSTQNGVRS